LILGWYHWPCNIDITKYRLYMTARIDSIVILKLGATDPRRIPQEIPQRQYSSVREKRSDFDVQMRPDEISRIFYLELY